MHHLGRADAVDDSDAGRLAPRVPGRRGQVLARRDASAQRAEIAPVEHSQHRAIGGGRGGADFDAVPLDRLDHTLGPGLVGHHRGAAEAEREDELHAQPEREGERRGAAPSRAARGRENVPREAVGAGQHVAVEVDTAFGVARRARGEGDQRGIVASGIDRGEIAGKRGDAPGELVRARIAVVEQRRTQARALRGGFLARGAARFVDDRMRDFRLAHDLGDLAPAQDRHGRDRHPAGFEHAEPGRDQHGPVASHQQHAIAGDQPLFLDQQARDARGQRVEFAVGPLPRAAQHRAVGGVAAREQLDRGVEPFGISQFGQVETEFGLPVGGRQAIAHEAVVVRAHRGTTAVVSISTSASRSTSAETATTAIAGKVLPSTSRQAAPIAGSCAT